MSGDSVEHLLVEFLPAGSITIALYGDQRLKCFQCLKGAFDADCAWFAGVFGRRLSHDRADGVGGSNVRPDLLPHELRRPATQDVHLHRLLQRPQIEFGVPAGAVEIRQVFGGHLLGV